MGGEGWTGKARTIQGIGSKRVWGGDRRSMGGPDSHEYDEPGKDVRGMVGGEEKRSCSCWFQGKRETVIRVLIRVLVGAVVRSDVTPFGKGGTA